MAQHDYVIANGTGAAVRSDLNGSLAAIVSNNSGATEPGTMYAYQWWADTTAGLLKIRNSANSAWVTVGTLASANLGLLSLGGGTMTGALLADDSGTAALPAISFDGDSDTGIFRAGANELAVATNGTQQITIDSSGRLLIGTSSALTNAYVGGTALAPAAQIEGNTGSTSTLSITRQTGSAANIILQRGVTGTPVAISHAVGQVTFNGFDGTNFRNAAAIGVEVDGTPSVGIVPGRIVFETANSSGTLTEAMRIDSEARVGIGTSTSSTVGVRIIQDAAGADLTVVSANWTATTGTIANLTNFSASRSTEGATITNLYGFSASSILTSATNNYGFYSDLPSGTNRWNFYANGTAANRFNGNVLIGGTTQPASATLALCLSNGTAPTGSITNGVVLYAQNVSASSELKVRDEAGNVTTLSPHNFDLIPDGPSEDMAWSYYSERDGKRINVDMLKAIRLLEQISGEKLVYSS
jgi:hypothetical protein